MSARLIARLDIKGPDLVKGVHLEGLRVLGHPHAFAALYYREGIDELLYVDVVASLYERNSLLDIISRTAHATFIPLTIQGGIRTADDVAAVLRAGGDRVAINTAAIARPDLVRELAERFGSSTIAVAIEAMNTGARYEAFVENGRQETGRDAIEWAQEAEALGAGELIVTSIEREGTGRGYDIDLTTAVAERVSIPVVANGGAGSAAHVAEVLTAAKVDAASVASILHYDALERLDPATGDTAGNVDYLRSGRRPKTIKPASTRAVKEVMAAQGIDVRPSEEAGADPASARP
jgi:cyclase